MKNYDHLNPGKFEVVATEIEKLIPRPLSDHANMKQIEEYLEDRYFTKSDTLHVSDVKTFCLPHKLKRNSHDSAMLICFKRGDKQYCKRHNNSQHLSV